MKLKSLILFSILSFTLFSQDRTLPIPKLVSGDNIKLNIQHGSINLPFGVSKTMGFNGDYLGPTIMVNKDEFLSFKINNDLNEDTTVHWHGLRVPAEYDGGPHQIIGKGTVWEPEFKIIQSASTLWYHPHLMGKTGEHVYNGLAGLFIINDDYSKSLKIPKDYGVNDIPIILQDRDIDRNGSFVYSPNMHDEVFGYFGNIILVNGAFEPVLNINAGTYRFRVLNGSNSSIFRVRFSNDKKFTVIAGDGGFLPKSLSTSEIIISPGERYEILTDFDTDDESFLITDIYGGSSFKSMKIVTSNREGVFYTHPETFLSKPVEYNQKSNTKREFLMETQMMGRFTINGKAMSMDRVDFSLPVDSTEIWTIKNIGFGMMQVPHSFHVHDTQFSVISVNDKKPGALYSGLKDTILIMPGDKVEIAVNFIEYLGKYMYHCHFLEHEDSGMMGQFLVE